MTSTPSRRTVLRATAWTAPVVAVAATAPAFAASTAPTGFRINATPSRRYSFENDVRELAIGASNPTAAPLTVTVFIDANTVGGGSEPYPYNVWWESWTWNGHDPASDTYSLSTTVAPSADSPTFYFAWSWYNPEPRNVALTATAPGLDVATLVVPLRFDQPLPAARRVPSTSVPSGSLQLNR
ncbi:hypothetical protein ACOACO_17330 [Nocardioides sp. CPCC 205120]|uniref:hypothetical protein n=1 Tax=Nocardioides sp. CPCC 205120 TaxID=3406462 RepID=UPI003B50C0C1